MILVSISTAFAEFAWEEKIAILNARSARWKRED